MTIGRFFLAVTIILIVFSLDQLSKELILASFLPGEDREIVPGFFNLVLTFNKGVAFGIFSGIDHDGLRMTTLLFTTLLAFVVIAVYLKGFTVLPTVVLWGASLVIGGALGNLIDRLRHGAVTDFLDFHLGGYHWPAFNFADSAICLGVLLLVFSPTENKNELESPHTEVKTG